MTFGAASFNSPELIISKEAFDGCDSVTQVCPHLYDSLPLICDMASYAGTLTQYQALGCHLKRLLLRLLKGIDLFCSARYQL